MTKIWIPHPASLFCTLLQGLLSQSEYIDVKSEWSLQVYSHLYALIEHKLLTLLLHAYEGNLLGDVPAVLHHLGVAAEVGDCLEDDSTVDTGHRLAFLIRHLLSNPHRHFGAGLGGQGSKLISTKENQTFYFMWAYLHPYGAGSSCVEMMTGPPLNSSTEVNTGAGEGGACLSFTGIWKCSDVSLVPIVAFTSPKDWSSSMIVIMTFY